MATQRGRKTASGRKRTNNRKRNTRRKQDSFSTEVKDEVILLLGIAVTILLFLSNFHLIGKAGDAVSAVMFGVFGILAYITPPVLFLGILFLILNLGNRVATIKLLAGTFLFLDLEVVAALIGGIGNAGSTVASYYSYANTHKMSGGVIGSALAGGLTKTIGMVGTVALVLILMMLCLVLLTEKSIVRPVFSYYGKLVIDDSAIKAIVASVVKAKEFVKKVAHIHVNHLRSGEEDQGIKISCEIVLSYGNHLPTLLAQTQRRVREAVEFMTGMVVHEINIMVKALYVEA